MALLYQSKFDI